MTIAFPKFPNKRKQPQPSNDPMVNENDLPSQATNTAPLTATQSLDMLLNEPVQPPTDTISEAQLAELKEQLRTQQSIKPKKNKLLPVLAGVLLLTAIGAIAYPMYQSMAEEKAAAAVPNVAPKPATPPKPVSAPTPTNNPPSNTTAAPVVVTTQPPAPTSSVAHSETPPETSKSEDLQKPILVDTSPTNTSAPSPAEAKPKTEVSSETKTAIKTDTSTAQTTSAKPTANKSSMSYDEFVKTSDSTVFIEAPSKHK